MILIVRTVFDDGDGYELYRIDAREYESACVAVNDAKDAYDDDQFAENWKGFYDYVEDEFKKRGIDARRENYGLASVDML